MNWLLLKYGLHAGRRWNQAGVRGAEQVRWRRVREEQQPGGAVPRGRPGPQSPRQERR
jgi:hypothetical protein